VKLVLALAMGRQANGWTVAADLSFANPQWEREKIGRVECPDTGLNCG
jgi:hypothetical protein